MSLPSSRPGQLQTGYWGDHDGTIDFCETNYDHTYLIAEFINTLSNAVILVLAAHGAFYARRARLPTRVAVCYAGQSLIGFGSILFHATLRHSFQILDEVPMIWCTSLLAWCAFETSEGYDHVAYFSPFTLALVVFNALTTLSCILQLSPTIHEVAFGLLVTLAAFRIFFLLRFRAAALRARDPQTFAAAGRLFVSGIGVFLVGFAIWNVDNLFCESHLQPWRAKVGYPTAYLLEGHAYWHAATGYAPFVCITGASFLMLSIKEPANTFVFTRSPWGLPYIVRLPSPSPSTAVVDGKSAGADEVEKPEKTAAVDVAGVKDRVAQSS